jgi:hypothetical protein
MNVIYKVAQGIGPLTRSELVTGYTMWSVAFTLLTRAVGLYWNKTREIQVGLQIIDILRLILALLAFHTLFIWIYAWAKWSAIKVITVVRGPVEKKNSL